MKNPAPQTPFVIENPTIVILDAPPTPGAPEMEIFEAVEVDARLIGPGPAGWRPADSDLSEADFILTWRAGIDAELLERAGRCLMIAHYGPGAGDGVATVALEEARTRGIYVASVPDYCPEDWADETFHLLLNLARELAEAPVRSLAGLRLGVVGLGSVGRQVARRARACAMEVWACDPFVGQDQFDQEGVRRADLDDLMGISEIVTLHLPLGPATRGLVDAANLALMREAALLVNTSAPDLIDLDALAGALDRRRPLAAAFDEDLARRLTPGHPLLGQPRLRHGPRRAGTSPQCAAACRRRVARLLVHVLHGNRPAHLLIDPPCPRHMLLLAGAGW